MEMYINKENQKRPVSSTRRFIDSHLMQQRQMLNSLPKEYVAIVW